MIFLFVFISVIIGLLLILTIGGIITCHFVYTPPFKDANGYVLPGSIAEFKRIKLGNCSQAVLIRGKSIDNPVLLYLHSGPGLSETGMMRNMNGILENYYTMVYLDQRGGGKSFSFLNDYKKFTTEQLIQDIHELTLYLKKKFKKEKIIITGHSFGAGFGAYAAAVYPEDYSLFIRIAQPVNPCEIDRLAYAWNIKQAEKSKNGKALDELEKVKGFWNLKNKNGYFNGMMVNKKWVGYYGGQIVGHKGFVPYVLKNSLSHEFTVFDYAPYMLGMIFTGPASWNIMITTDLKKQSSEFKCPVIILNGRQDYNSVPDLVEDYYNFIKAPLKKIYWFEKSAHFPNYEEKEFFQKIMINEVLPLLKSD